MKISDETKKYIMLIITVLLFTYFASELAGEPEVPTGTVVIPST